MSLKMAATCYFFCVFVCVWLLKFGSFFDDAFCKNIAQKISMPKRLKELFVRHSASTK